jgi:hypothetical protein
MYARPKITAIISSSSALFSPIQITAKNFHYKYRFAIFEIELEYFNSGLHLVAITAF